MDATDVLADLYGRIPGRVRAAVEGLDAEQLATMPDGRGNSVGWLIWHLTRVQDSHVAELAGHDQLWVADGWAERFGREADPSDTGWGHTTEQVAAIRPESAELLIDHYDATHQRTVSYLDGLGPDDLDRVVDTRWDPPVTLGVRLVSVADDDLEHAAQAAYLRGLLLGG